MKLKRVIHIYCSWGHKKAKRITTFDCIWSKRNPHWLKNYINKNPNTIFVSWNISRQTPRSHYSLLRLQRQGSEGGWMSAKRVNLSHNVIVFFTSQRSTVPHITPATCPPSRTSSSFKSTQQTQTQTANQNVEQTFAFVHMLQVFVMLCKKTI